MFGLGLVKTRWARPMALHYLQCCRRGSFLKAKSLTQGEERDSDVEAPVAVLETFSAIQFCEI